MANQPNFSPQILQNFWKSRNVFTPSFQTVGGNPPNFVSSEKGYLIDDSKKKYLDLYQFGGSVLSDNSDQEFQNKVFDLQHLTSEELQFELSQKLLEVAPENHQIKFFSSESEVYNSTIKLARAFTNREKILKFSGAYHGDSDALLKDSGASNYLTENLNSKGIPKSVSELTLVSEFNNLEDFEYLTHKNADDLAAIIIEPVAANMGCIPAETLFLQKIREFCNQNKTLLIFDETKTGFRLTFGGAQEVYSCKADLVIYGNNLSNGFPMAALLADENMMRLFSPNGDVFFGNHFVDPMSLATAITNLNLIKQNPNFYQKLNRKAEFLDFEVGKLLNEKNIQHRINRKGSMLSLFFHVQKVSNYQEAADSNTSLFNTFFHFLLDSGIFLPPHALKSWWISPTISDRDMDLFLQTVKKFQFS